MAGRAASPGLSGSVCRALRGLSSGAGRRVACPCRHACLSRDRPSNTQPGSQTLLAFTESFGSYSFSNRKAFLFCENDKKPNAVSLFMFS